MLSAIEVSALKAAYPFGGSAEGKYSEVIFSLEKAGLVEVVSFNVIDGSINYCLTAAGKVAS